MVAASQIFDPRDLDEVNAARPSVSTRDPLPVEPSERSTRPRSVPRRHPALVAILLGLCSLPFPQLNAAASCAAPYLKTNDMSVLERDPVAEEGQARPGETGAVDRL